MPPAPAVPASTGAAAPVGGAAPAPPLAGASATVPGRALREPVHAGWHRLGWIALALLPCAVAVLSLSLGAVPIAPETVLRILGHAAGLPMAAPDDAQAEAVLLAVRLPRVLFGLLTGAVLGMAGAAMQGLFRNALADPGLLGVSSGATVGATAMIVLAGAFTVPPAWQLWLVPASAFGGALVATLLVLQVAAGLARGTAALLLSGVAIAAIGGAGTGLLTYVATDAQLRSIAFWQLGSLGGVTWDAGPAAALLLLALLALPRVGAALNLLQLGEAEAGHLGVRVRRLQWQVVLLVALGVGSAVAVTGMIGFVGLVVPHIVRLLTGPDHRRLLPASACAGAALLALADLLARTIVMPAELPIGILTALAGAPLLLSLVRRHAATAAA